MTRFANQTLVAIAAFTLLVAAQPALAGVGEVIALDGDPAMPVSFVDDGNTYFLGLGAIQQDPGGGGDVTMGLAGPGLTLCTAGGDPAVDPSFVPPPFNPQPLPGIGCGTAFGMSVSVDGCVADISFHGYVHSDHPLVTYMGMMTADVKFKKKAGEANGKIEITIHTPKEPIKLKANSVSGLPVFMTNCP